MERVNYDDGGKYLLSHELLRIFLFRYVNVLNQLYEKTIIDAGCGSGLGTFIYSLVAKKILAVDYSKEALAKAKKLHYSCPVTFIQADLNTVKLPKADVCVAIEVIEHLKPGNDFLKRLNVKKIIYSIPLKNPGPYHLIDFATEQEVFDYITSQGWQTVASSIDYGDSDMSRANASVIGYAIKKK